MKEEWELDLTIVILLILLLYWLPCFLGINIESDSGGVIYPHSEKRAFGILSSLNKEQGLLLAEMENLTAFVTLKV